MGIMSCWPVLRHAGYAKYQLADDTWEEQMETLETPNLPAIWVEKLPVVRRRFRIERLPASPDQDVAGVDDYPWYVQETTRGDDTDDYGRMATQADALALVKYMLKGQRYGAQ